MKTLRVLTLNCWSERFDFEKRWPILARELRALRPDVACLQEVFKTKKAEALRKSLNASICVEGPKKSGLVILSNSKCVASGSIAYKAKSPHENYGRYALWARLKIGGAEWDFFNTHLSWRPEDASTREQQVSELRDWIDEKNSGARPVVVTGDFNTISQSNEMQFLLGKKWIYVSREGRARVIKAHRPFQDTFSAGPNTWSYSNSYTLRADLPERRIDYILRGQVTGPGPSRVCFNRPNEEKNFPSDHFGVMTIFRI